MFRKTPIISVMIVFQMFTTIYCSENQTCRQLPATVLIPDNYTTAMDTKAIEERVLQLQKIISESHRPSAYKGITGIPKDCNDIYRRGLHTDGVFSISPDGRCPFLVYCDMINGGWTLIQKRESGGVNFSRSWDEYVNGFGDMSGDPWLGLDKIHRLTKSVYQIYFDIENYDGTREYAHYSAFTVHGASTLYRMNVDALGYNGSIVELFSYHDNMRFSTFDKDNDNMPSSCSLTYGDAGWWFNNCYKLGNLNGVYGQQNLTGGIGYFASGYIHIKNVRIKIKAKQ